MQCHPTLFRRFVHPSCCFWQSSVLAEMVSRYEKNEYSLIIVGVIKLSDLPGAQRPDLGIQYSISVAQRDE